MVSTHLGKLSGERTDTLREIIGEEMIGQLVEAETLFYTLVDVIGVGSQTAQLLVRCCFNGGAKVNAKKITDITMDIKGKTYHLSTRRVHRFMKTHMKSTRIELISIQPQVWQMNGFSTFEPPYIAGYAREGVAGILKDANDIINELVKLKDRTAQKIEELNGLISTFPNNLSDLVNRRREIQNEHKNICAAISAYIGVVQQEVL